MKKKKKRRNKNKRTMEKKENWEKKKGQKLRLLTVPPCVFNYQNAIRNKVMETENTI